MIGETLTPNLMVNHVEDTIKFYQEQLGFACAMTVPETAPFDWALITKDNIRIMLQTIESLRGEYPQLPERINSSLTLYMDITDIENYFAEIQHKVQVIKPLNTTFYGKKEFAIMDNNGYLVVFSQMTST